MVHSKIRLAATAFAGLFVALAATSASASLVWHSTVILDPGLGNPTSEGDYIESVTGSDPLTFLHKETDGGGALDGSQFQIQESGGGAFDEGVSTEIEISWDLTGTGYELRYVLLKDGSICDDFTNDCDQVDKGSLYTLYYVTADQYLISGGWQDACFVHPTTEDCIDKGISHVSFFGLLGGDRQVPEPGTLALLGGGLLLLGLRGRRRRS